MNSLPELAPFAFAAAGLLLVLAGAAMSLAEMLAASARIGSASVTGRRVRLARTIFVAGWLIFGFSMAAGMLVVDTMMHGR